MLLLEFADLCLDYQKNRLAYKILALANDQNIEVMSKKYDIYHTSFDPAFFQEFTVAPKQPYTVEPPRPDNQKKSALPV